MGIKKVIGCSILTGAIIAFHIAIINGSLDYKLFHLRRKVNCLNRKVNINQAKQDINITLNI